MLPRSAGCWLTVIAVLVSAAGCGTPAPPLTEVKGANLPITAEELEVLQRLLERMPKTVWANWQPCYPPPPDWPDSRTLPVADLLAEEQRRLADRWDAVKVGERLGHERDVMKILKREQVTPEQFAGLVLAAGAAWSSSQFSQQIELKEDLRRGESTVKQLAKDGRPFSTLTVEDRDLVLRSGAWISRLDRAQRFRDVPAENVELVRTAAEWLPKNIPAEFSENPFEDLIDRQETFGVPFEEQQASGFDDAIRWERSQAIQLAPNGASGPRGAAFR